MNLRKVDYRVKQNSKDMGLAQPRLDYDVVLIQRDGQRDCRISSGLWPVGCSTGSIAHGQYGHDISCLFSTPDIVKIMFYIDIMCRQFTFCF